MVMMMIMMIIRRRMITIIVDNRMMMMVTESDIFEVHIRLKGVIYSDSQGQSLLGCN